MKDEHLDRLSKLVPLWETCAKLGGVPMLTKVQDAVARDLDATLLAIAEDEEDELPLRQKTPHEIATSGNSLLTRNPLPPGVDEQGRPLPVPEEELTEQQRADKASDEEAAARRAEENEREFEEGQKRLVEGYSPTEPATKGPSYPTVTGSKAADPRYPTISDRRV